MMRLSIVMIYFKFLSLTKIACAKIKTTCTCPEFVSVNCFKIKGTKLCDSCKKKTQLNNIEIIEHLLLKIK